MFYLQSNFWLNRKCKTGIKLRMLLPVFTSVLLIDFIYVEWLVYLMILIKLKRANTFKHLNNQNLYGFSN
jgi:hypothetical protein